MNSKEFLQRNGLNEGDLIELETGTGSITGYVAPSANEKILSLKLPSGYNIGIEVEEGFTAKKLPGKKEFRKPEAKSAPKIDGLPKISVLHTGGTIASRVDYRTGTVYNAFAPEDLLAMFPELSRIGNFSSRHLSDMWSDDLRFEHFGVISNAVREEAEKGAEGIIIGMGTDNIAVAAAALSFALEKCPIPVILVGAQRSSDRGSSDAAMNLICAATFIAKTDFAGVAICMHEGTSDDWCAVLPACKTRKLHTSRRDAFRPVNSTAIARVNYKTKEISFAKDDYARKSKGEKVSVKPKFEEKVGLLKITINMFPEQFEFYSKNGFKGLVIEGTGLGHTPGQMPDEITKRAHEKIYPAIGELAKNCVVVMTSQCLYGRVHMHVYDKGADLVKLGVIPGEDMLPETAFVKLAWLLGNHSPEEARKLIAENLRGEISPRTEAQAPKPDEMNK
ncbi:MAG: Glu-tRNA(Gln) amidotransferase subunit GatD [archaeon]